MPLDRPQLVTARLLLRPFRLTDAEDVCRLAGDREVASTTLSIPHPYDLNMAETWIAAVGEGSTRSRELVFALQRTDDQALVGAIGLVLQSDHARAELGYWIGKPYWGQGYATEAGRAVVRYGFGTLGLNRISGHHFVRNPASGRVMAKLGMVHEGRLRQYVCKGGVYEDVDVYAVLRQDTSSNPA
jgi:[ribosomal protein S5]-alanine N-acetyltransferase